MRTYRNTAESVTSTDYFYYYDERNAPHPRLVPIDIDTGGGGGARIKFGSPPGRSVSGGSENTPLGGGFEIPVFTDNEITVVSTNYFATELFAFVVNIT